MKLPTETIAAYYQSVLPGDVDLYGCSLQASCPFHFDNDLSFSVYLRNGDYACRCGYGSIQQFEMRRVGEDETPRGWTEADRRIITIVKKSQDESDD